MCLLNFFNAVLHTMGYFGSHLHLMGPACGSSAGRWCSSVRCCAGMLNYRLSAGWGGPANKIQKGQQEKGQDIKTETGSRGLKLN